MPQSGRDRGSTPISRGTVPSVSTSKSERPDHRVRPDQPTGNEREELRRLRKE
jgi:hypothetical protein